MISFIIKRASGINFLLFSVITTFLVIAYYNLSNGFIISLDTNTFSRWSDHLIRLNFNLYAYYLENTFTTPPFFYTIPIILISLCKIIFGSYWEYAYMGLNLFWVLLSIIYVCKCLLTLKVRPILISFTIPLMILSVDWMVWPRWVLTDTIFAFLVILAIHLLIKCFLKKKINYINLSLLIITILLTRPASIPVVSTIVFFIILFETKVIYKNKIILLLLLFAFIFTPIICTFLHYFIDTAYSGSFRAIRILDWAKDGIIIWDRPETWIAPPASFIDFIYFYFLRLINFFNPYAESFSTIHILLNLFQAFYILLAVFIWLFLIGNMKFLDNSIILILTLTLFIAAFHSFILLDYDWRYRFPIILPLMMIVPITMENFLKKIKK